MLYHDNKKLFNFCRYRDKRVNKILIEASF